MPRKTSAVTEDIEEVSVFLRNRVFELPIIPEDVSDFGCPL